MEKRSSKIVFEKNGSKLLNVTWFKYLVIHTSFPDDEDTYMNSNSLQNNFD